MTPQHFTRVLVVHHAFAAPIVERLRPARPDIEFRAAHPKTASAADVAWAEALVGFKRPAAGLGNARWVHCIGAGVDGWTRDFAWPDDVLLTRTQNEFNDPVYNFNYPGYWAYSGMDLAYKNLGAVFSQVHCFAPGSDSCYTRHFKSRSYDR